MSIAGELNSKLVKHYKCFNEERFFVDEANEDYISIVSTSIGRGLVGINSGENFPFSTVIK